MAAHAPIELDSDDLLVALRAIAAGRAPGTSSVAWVTARHHGTQLTSVIEALRRRESPPDAIVVCVDGCPPETGIEAEAAGAIVHRASRRRPFSHFSVIPGDSGLTRLSGSR